MNTVVSTALYCTLCKELNLGALRCVLASYKRCMGDRLCFITAQGRQCLLVHVP